MIDAPRDLKRADTVALAVAGLLLATLAGPSLASLRESNRVERCQDNLRRIGLGVNHYVANSEYYPAVITRVPKHHGWMASILPYLERNDLYERYDFSVHWCDPANADVIIEPISILECPAASYPSRIAEGETQHPYRAATLDYLATNRISPTVINEGWLPGSTRINGILTRQEMVHWTAVRDGLSQTILAAEVAGTPAKYVHRDREPAPMYGMRGFGAWADAGIYFQGHGNQADGRDWPGPYTVNQTNDDAIYSFHRGGANLVMGDGSVRFVSEQLDLFVLLAAITRDNNDALSGTELIEANPSGPDFILDRVESAFDE